jgi:hypothetical protein
VPRDDKLYSGFVRHDYVLTFSVGAAENRDKLVALCKGPWLGDEVNANTWEVSNDLSPEKMEDAILACLGDDDKATYYYLSDAKRLFRVMLG